MENENTPLQSTRLTLPHGKHCLNELIYLVMGTEMQLQFLLLSCGWVSKMQKPLPPTQ